MTFSKTFLNSRISCISTSNSKKKYRLVNICKTAYLCVKHDFWANFKRQIWTVLSIYSTFFKLETQSKNLKLFRVRLIFGMTNLIYPFDIFLFYICFDSLCKEPLREAVSLYFYAFFFFALTWVYKDICWNETLFPAQLVVKMCMLF